MANHGMVRLDKLPVIDTETVQNTVDMDNGSVVMLGAYVAGETNAYQVATPATATILTTEVLLVNSPAVNGPNYVPGTTLKDFYNLANSYSRAYRLPVGTEFTITTDQITGTPVVGQYLIPANASFKLAVAADLSGGTRFAAIITNASATFGYTGSGLTKQAAVTARVVKI